MHYARASGLETLITIVEQIKVEQLNTHFVDDFVDKIILFNLPNHNYENREWYTSYCVSCVSRKWNTRYKKLLPPIMQ